MIWRSNDSNDFHNKITIAPMKIQIVNYKLKLIGLFMVMNCLCYACSYQSNVIDTSVVDLLDPVIYNAPDIFWEPNKDQGNIKALFYKTLPHKGKETRAFAYIGIPKSDHPVPAMVLVHGGGGKAFYEWVKLWNDRGYAAIAMSLEGHMPDNSGAGKHRHEYSGPKRVGRFDDIDQPLKEQWMYHAISDIIIGHSLLASLSEVDANKIGITGISWGGILSSLVSGIDKRLKCAMPLYGAGYLYESKGHFGNHGDSSAEFIEKKKYWDPAEQFKNSVIPTLWVNGDSDGHFSINITSKSYELTKDHGYLSIHPNMKHGHKRGWDPEIVPEIYAFANYILKGEVGFCGILEQPFGRKGKLKYQSPSTIIEATVYYLDEPLTYREIAGQKHGGPKTWQTVKAIVNNDKNLISYELPAECQTYYINLKDDRGHIISSKLVELEEDDE